MFKKPIWFAALSAALEDPSQWEVDEHVIRHKRSSIELWIANGWSGLHSYMGRGPDISIINKIRLWPKVRRLMDSIVLLHLSVTK